MGFCFALASLKLFEKKQGEVGGVLEARWSSQLKILVFLWRASSFEQTRNVIVSLPRGSVINKTPFKRHTISIQRARHVITWTSSCIFFDKIHQEKLVFCQKTCLSDSLGSSFVFCRQNSSRKNKASATGALSPRLGRPRGQVELSMDDSLGRNTQTHTQLWFHCTRVPEKSVLILQVLRRPPRLEEASGAGRFAAVSCHRLRRPSCQVHLSPNVFILTRRHASAFRKPAT